MPLPSNGYMYFGAETYANNSISQPFAKGRLALVEQYYLNARNSLEK
jgi:hypothetical protein